MTSRVKQALVLGGLVAGAFGLATLLNKRRRKRPAQARELAELEQLDAELEGLRHETRNAEPSP
jgi:hypothetical protein